MVFELRIDGNPTGEGVAQGDFLAGETNVRARITGIFKGLSAGSHTASMWIIPYQGTAAAVAVGPGVGSASLIVKEYK
jgi:hypothetical protein